MNLQIRADHTFFMISRSICNCSFSRRKRTNSAWSARFRTASFVSTDSQWHGQIKLFLRAHSIQILNVSGPRASNAPDIEQFVYETLIEAVKTFFFI